MNTNHLNDQKHIHLSSHELVERPICKGAFPNDTTACCLVIVVQLHASGPVGNRENSLDCITVMLVRRNDFCKKIPFQMHALQCVFFDSNYHYSQHHPKTIRLQCSINGVSLVKSGKIKGINSKVCSQNLSQGKPGGAG